MVGVKFFYASFNQNTQEVIHVIVIYKPPKMQILFYFNFKNYFGKNSYWLSNCSDWRF